MVNGVYITYTEKEGEVFVGFTVTPDKDYELMKSIASKMHMPGNKMSPAILGTKAHPFLAEVSSGTLYYLLIMVDTDLEEKLEGSVETYGKRHVQQPLLAHKITDTDFETLPEFCAGYESFPDLWEAYGIEVKSEHPKADVASPLPLFTVRPRPAP